MLIFVIRPLLLHAEEILKVEINETHFLQVTGRMRRHLYSLLQLNEDGNERRQAFHCERANLVYSS